MSSGPEDWIAVLLAVERGEKVAIVKVTNLITGFLARYRAYDLRESWDDLCQEVLIALIQNARKGALRNPRAFVSYAGAITRHKLTDWIQKMHKPGAPDRQGNPDEASVSADPRNPAGEPRDPGLLLDLSHALEALPNRQRLVIEAVYLQGMSYEEATRHLGIPFGTLKRLQTQGLKELREKMGLEVHSS
jgi:RNA polymerase sigma factor (sigma-70 family)